MTLKYETIHRVLTAIWHRPNANRARIMYSAEINYTRLIEVLTLLKDQQLIEENNLILTAKGEHLLYLLDQQQQQVQLAK